MHHLHAFILVVSERTICIRFLKNYANYNHLSFHWVIDLKHVTSLKKRLWYSCFPVSFNKYLRRLTEHLLSTVSFVIYSGLRSSCLQMFFKIVTLKNIHRKTPVSTWRPKNLLKTLVNIVKCLKTAFLQNTSEPNNHIGSCLFQFQVKNCKTVKYRNRVGI